MRISASSTSLKTAAIARSSSRKPSSARSRRVCGVARRRSVARAGSSSAKRPRNSCRVFSRTRCAVGRARCGACRQAQCSRSCRRNTRSGSSRCEPNAQATRVSGSVMSGRDGHCGPRNTRPCRRRVWPRDGPALEPPRTGRSRHHASSVDWTCGATLTPVALPAVVPEPGAGLRRPGETGVVSSDADSRALASAPARSCVASSGDENIDVRIPARARQRGQCSMSKAVRQRIARRQRGQWR